MSAVAVAEDRPPAAICDPAAGIGRVAAPEPGARRCAVSPPQTPSGPLAGRLDSWLPPVTTVMRNPCVTARSSARLKRDPYR